MRRPLGTMRQWVGKKYNFGMSDQSLWDEFGLDELCMNERKIPD